MSNEAIMALIQLGGAVVTAVSGGFVLWIAYKQAALKTELDKQALASKQRYEKLDETCRIVDEKTDQQTVLLNKLQGTAEKTGLSLEDTQSAVKVAALETKVAVQELKDMGKPKTE